MTSTFRSPLRPGHVRPLVVLCPVRDEEAVLPTFLLAYGSLADEVIVVDQCSTDRSREICRAAPGVRLIENPDPGYDEAARTRMLVLAARERWGNGAVLVAVDADEIPCPESMKSVEWAALTRLPAGTAIVIRKPDVLAEPYRLRAPHSRFLLGLVDDGREVDGHFIHSPRVPARPADPEYHASSLRILHLARLYGPEFAARQAMYAMLENVRGSKTLWQRWKYYSPESYRAYVRGSVEPMPEPWVAAYAAAGLFPFSVITRRANRFHLRALRLIAEHGGSRFRWDDIWRCGLERALETFRERGDEGLPPALPMLAVGDRIVHAFLKELVRLRVRQEGRCIG